MRVGVATLQRGRHRHLARQACGVAAQTCTPAAYVVVSMDPDPPTPLGATVVHRPVGGGDPLPLAAARNAAVAALLDVDCIPGADLVARYAAADADALLAGPVGRLGPLPDDRDPTADELAHARDAPGPRPVPPDGAVVDDPRHELLWSLSFAVRPAVHRRIGGFDEGFVGYGAEDTDDALRARAAGVPLRWVGGAWAYHQHHPSSSPPREHLDDIVRNATRFRRRHGRWPMEGWLERFAGEGLVEWDPRGVTLRRRAVPAAG